jgi:hypothetical protein
MTEYLMDFVPFLFAGIFVFVIGKLLYGRLRHGSWTGSFLGGSIDRTVGEILLSGSFASSHTLKVHAMKAPDGGSDFVAIVLVAKAPMAASMQPHEAPGRGPGGIPAGRGALTMRIGGSCHCGNIGFTLDWLPEPTTIPARACGCSFCVKHGGVWTSCPGGRLRVTVRSPARVSRYAFGTKTAEFHVCRDCGIVPVVTSLIAGRLYAVVSVNAFDGVAASRLERTPASFDGESEGDRLARRRRNWIGDVEIDG